MEGSALKSVIEYSPEHHFPLENIPFGAFYVPDSEGTIHCCTRIGDQVIDLAIIEEAGLFKGDLFSKLDRKNVFAQPYLNDFMSLGRDYWKEAR
jgi:fumarylacetoacetase